MILAIDYGTSNTLAALANRARVTTPLPLDPEASDPTVFRSLLYFPDQNRCFYGQRAINEYVEQHGEGRLIRSIKKFLPAKDFMGSWIENRVVRIEDLVGFFLLETKRRVEKHAGTSVDSVLLGRPARYSEDSSADQLAIFRMERAARFAGFKNVFFFEEPLAAALDLRAGLKDWKTVLIVDLGGGTSDFTVMRIGPAEFKNEHVLAKGGVSLAGDALDGNLMRDLFAPDFGSEVQYRVPLSRNLLQMPKSLLDKISSPAEITQLKRDDYMLFLKDIERWSTRERDKRALKRLFTLCEEQLGFAFFESIEGLKKAASENLEYEFSFPHDGVEIQRTIQRSSVVEALEHTLEKILNCMNDVLQASGVKNDNIDLVYSTGGTSRFFRVQEELLKMFGPEKVQSKKYFHSVIDGLAARAQEILTT